MRRSLPVSVPIVLPRLSRIVDGVAGFSSGSIGGRSDATAMNIPKSADTTASTLRPKSTTSTRSLRILKRLRRLRRRHSRGRKRRRLASSSRVRGNWTTVPPSACGSAGIVVLVRSCWLM